MMHSNSRAHLRAIRVYLDAINPTEPLDAFTRGERWNGWECPLFTREQAARLARIWRATIHCSAEYNANTDEWAFYEPGNPDRPIRARGQTESDSNGHMHRVYRIGQGWCWVAEAS